MCKATVVKMWDEIISQILLNLLVFSDEIWLCTYPVTMVTNMLWFMGRAWLDTMGSQKFLVFTLCMFFLCLMRINIYTCILVHTQSPLFCNHALQSKKPRHAKHGRGVTMFRQLREHFKPLDGKMSQRYPKEVIKQAHDRRSWLVEALILPNVIG